MSVLALFPGRVGGEKAAWYPLLAQAPLFPVYFRKIVSIFPNIIYIHAQAKKLLQSFSVESVSQKDDSTIPLLSSVM